MTVWVVAETAGTSVPETSVEVLDEAVELARPDCPGVLAVAGSGAGEALEALAAHGAGRIVLLERDEETASPEADAASAAAWLASQADGGGGGPTVLLSHTPYGRAVAPRLAAALDAAVAPEAVGVRRDARGGLAITRPAYGGRLYALVTVPPGVPAVVTFRPRVLGVGPPASERTVPVERHPALARLGIRSSQRRRVIRADPRTVDLRDAERIVAGGRGVGGPEGFGALQELADLLGAALGGSRVAVDLGWLPWERQIGQSGRTVRPHLYLACGISGASQHVMGMQAAETIIAIDTDRAAPMLGLAHLGVVADWRPVVTALIGELRARRTVAAMPAEPGR